MSRPSVLVEEGTTILGTCEVCGCFATVTNRHHVNSEPVWHCVNQRACFDEFMRL